MSPLRGYQGIHSSLYVIVMLPLRGFCCGLFPGSLYLCGMLTCHQAFYRLRQSLLSLYDEREAAAIAHETLYHITGLDKLQRLMEKDTLLTTDQTGLFEQFARGLRQGRPMQYVLGHTWFLGRRFRVDERVLIPRPETEELIQWIIDDCAGNTDALHILDIGTGSGCIPVSLKLAMPDIVAEACDISPGALQLAAENADTLGADVRFFLCDILNSEARSALPVYDVLVSNPPYIPVTERDTLHAHVKDFEPSLALFTPGDDPLVFYRAIAESGQRHLAPGGAIYCELHRDYATATADLFASFGYKTELRRDMHGNPRMLKGIMNYEL